MRMRILAAPLLLCAALPAQAITTCSASATPVAFGTYTPVTGTDSSGTITVSCTVILNLSGISYTISLNRGSNSTSFTPRQLAGPGGSQLEYNLYTDASRLSPFIWGDGTGGSITVSGDSGGGLLGSASWPYTVYGRIPAGQYVTPGSYGETITVTVDYTASLL